MFVLYDWDVSTIKKLVNTVVCYNRVSRHVILY